MPGSVGIAVVLPCAINHEGAMVSFSVSTSNVTAPFRTAPEILNEIPVKPVASIRLQLS